MPVLFLDIDGVLNTTASFRYLAGNRVARSNLQKHDQGVAAQTIVLDPVAVSLLTAVCQHAGASIVISSDWRKTIGDEEALSTLVRNGVPAGLFHERWSCPMKMTSEKWHDIGFWLEEETEGYGFDPEIDCFAIVDDRTFYLESSLYDHLVTTQSETGLTLTEARMLLDILGANEYPEANYTPISREDWETVLKAHQNNQITARRWLFEPREQGYPRAVYLAGKSGAVDTNMLRSTILQELPNN